MVGKIVLLAATVSVSLLLSGCPCGCEGTPESLVNGTITDSATGQPLAGVTVATTGNHYVLSDTNGKYSIRLADTLTALKQGYMSHEENIAQLPENTISTRNFSLTPGDPADMTAPPSPLPVALTSHDVESSVHEWKMPAEPEDLAGFVVYRGGKPLQLTALQQTELAWVGDVADCYTISALDATGNESPRSAEMCRVFSACPAAVSYRIVPDVRVISSSEVQVKLTVPSYLSKVTHSVYRDNMLLASLQPDEALTISYSDVSVTPNTRYCYSVAVASDASPGCDQLCITSLP